MIRRGVLAVSVCLVLLCGTVQAQAPTPKADDLSVALQQAQQELKLATEAIGKTPEYQRYLRMKAIVDYLTALKAEKAAAK